MAKKQFGKREPIKLPSEYQDVTQNAVAGGLNDFFLNQTEGKAFEEGFSSVLGTIVGNDNASKFSDLKKNSINDTVLGKDFVSNLMDAVNAIKDVIATDLNPTLHTMSLGLAQVLTSLNQILNQTKNGSKLDVIITLKNPKDFNTLSKFIDSLSLKNDIKKQVESFKDNLKLIQEVFDNNIQALYDSTMNQSEHLDYIAAQINKSTEIAISAAKVDAAELEESQSNAAEIIDSIAMLGFVMIIGGLIITGHEKLIIGSLKFGMTLGLFLMELMIPIGMLAVINKYLNSENSLDSILTFVIMSSIVMLAGAAFMMIPRMSFMALRFTKVFAIFLTAILLPLALITLISNSNAMKELEKVATFVTTATIIMLLGGLIFNLGGGKYWKDALKFGGVLALFMMEILIPVIIYGALVKKAFKIVENFNELVITCSVLMVLGALIFILGGGKYVKYALLFGVALMAFITLTLAPILLFSLFVNKSFKTLKELTIFIITATTIMIIGSLFMKNEQFWKNALLFGVVLMAFTSLVLLPVFVFGLVIKHAMRMMKNITIFLIAETALMLIGASLILNYPEYIIGALAFGVVLMAFMTLTLLPFIIYQKKLQQATPTLILFAAFIFVIGTVMMLGGIIIEKYWKGALGFTVLSSAFLYGMYMVVDKLGDKRKTEKLRRGIINALLITGLITAIGISFALINAMFPKFMDVIWAGAKVAVLTVFVIGFTFLAKLLNKINPTELTKGTFAAAGIAIVIGLLGLSMMIVNKAGITLELLGQVALLGLIVAEYAVILGIIGIGPIAGMVAIGEAVAAGITVVMALLGWSITVVHNGLEKVGGAKVALLEAGKMGLIIGAYGLMLGSLVLLIIPATLGAIAAGLIGAALIPLSITIMMVSGAIKLAEKAGDPQSIKTLLNGFMDAIPSVGFRFFFKTMKNVRMISAICNPLARTMSRIGRTVADLASLKVAIEWDKDGNPTKYRQLKENDFKLAANGVTKIITTMAEGIMLASAYYEQVDTKTLWKTLWASQKLGNVIGSISNGLQSYANLLIPIRWNDEGKPVEFRRMTDKDFTEAAMNIRKIILIVGGTIAQLASGSGGPIQIGDITINPQDFVNAIQDIPATGLRGLFGATNPSNFTRVLTASSQLGEMVSNIASGIQAFASMNMPIKWNDEGKPVEFKTLKEKDIIDASNNVRSILLVLAGTIMDVYHDPRAYSDGKNIFDSEVISTGFLGLKKTETPSKFEKTLAASIRLGELIANMAAGIQSFANLRIPSKYNEKGQAIEYQEVDLDKIKKKLPTVVKDILLAMTVSVMGAYSVYKDTMDPEKFQEVVDSFNPIGTLLGNIVTALKNYVDLQIPIYGKDGKVIGYTQLPRNYGQRVANNIKSIICTLSYALVNAYKSMDISAETLDAVLNSFIPVGKLVKDTAEAIVNYAAGRMVDPKTGKSVMIGPAVIESASKNIQDLIVCIVDAISKAYNSHKSIFKDQSESDSLYAISAQIIKAGELVKNTVELIKQFAAIKKKTIEEAAENIKLSVSSIPQAIIDGMSVHVESISEDTILSYQNVILSVNNFLSEMYKGVIKTIIDNRKNLETVLRYRKINNSDDTAYGIFSDIKVMTQGITSIINTLSISAAFSLLNETKESIIDSILYTFTNLVDYLVNLLPKINELSTMLSSTVLSSSFTSTVKNIVTAIATVLNDIIETNKTSFVNEKALKLNMYLFYRKAAYIENLNARIRALHMKLRGFNYDPKVYTDIQGAMNDVAVTINSIKTSFNSDFSGIGILRANDLNLIQKKVKSFSSIVREMIDASSSRIENTSLFDIVAEGISTINEKVSRIDATKIRNIDNETKSLTRFVKAVDGIDVSKASKLTSLMDSMANLADKMGGFDKLTDVINSDLKEVLNKLSEKIDEAKDTIKRAERIENERQKKLQENIKTIKGVMKEAITINVGKIDEDGNIKAGYEKTK